MASSDGPSCPFNRPRQFDAPPALAVEAADRYAALRIGRQRHADRVARGFRLVVLGIYICDQSCEEIGAGRNPWRAPEQSPKAQESYEDSYEDRYEDSCEEKVTLRCAPVHSLFTPVSLMLMAAVLPFRHGDQRAPARR
jgi:hypothetical protein